MTETAVAPVEITVNQEEHGELNERPRRGGNRPRPRGGARERERKERAARRARLQDNDQNDPRNAAQEGHAAGSGAPNAGNGNGGANGQRNSREGKQVRNRVQNKSRGPQPRLFWRTAVDESTGEPLGRDALWTVASNAALVSPASQEDSGAAGGAVGSGASNPHSSHQQGEGSGENFEEGHTLQIARDHKTGRVVAVREVWMASSVRRNPRRQSQTETKPQGQEGSDGGAAMSAPPPVESGAPPDAGQGGEANEAIQRIMERLDL